MAVPKGKSSPSRQGMRRAHKKVSVDSVVACTNCGEWHRPHHLCMHCGHYKGRHVLVTRAQKRTAKAAQQDRD